MAMNKEELLAAIRDNFSTLDYIRPSEIPNIDLYMDQVTTFMDKRLAKSRRYDNDKIPIRLYPDRLYAKPWYDDNQCTGLL